MRSLVRVLNAGRSSDTFAGRSGSRKTSKGREPSGGKCENGPDVCFTRPAIGRNDVRSRPASCRGRATVKKNASGLLLESGSPKIAWPFSASFDGCRPCDDPLWLRSENGGSREHFLGKFSTDVPVTLFGFFGACRFREFFRCYSLFRAVKPPGVIVFRERRLIVDWKTNTKCRTTPSKPSDPLENSKLRLFSNFVSLFRGLRNNTIRVHFSCDETTI